jgi:hypothetical protein
VFGFLQDGQSFLLLDLDIKSSDFKVGPTLQLAELIKSQKGVLKLHSVFVYFCFVFIDACLCRDV